MSRGRLASGFAVVLLAALTADAADRGPRPGRGSLVYDPQQQDWLEIPPPVPGTEQGDLDIARALLAEREYKKARRAFRDWRAAWPDSPLWPDALFLSADTEVYAVNEGKPGDLWRAHEWYDEIITGWTGTDLAERALRRELIVAEMFLFKGQKRRIFRGLLKVSAVEEAIDILDRIVNERAPGTPLAEQALRMQADYHFQQGEHLEAERAYARLARDFPRGRYERLALQRSADAAFAGFAGVDFDDAPLLEAEERYVQFADRYPKAASEQGVPQILERIRDSRAQKEFSIAQYYERARKRSAAVFYYRSVARHWPDTLWADRARSRLTALGADEPPPPNNE